MSRAQVKKRVEKELRTRRGKRTLQNGCGHIRSNVLLFFHPMCLKGFLAVFQISHVFNGHLVTQVFYKSLNISHFIYCFPNPLIINYLLSLCLSHSKSYFDFTAVYFSLHSTCGIFMALFYQHASQFVKYNPIVSRMQMR